MNTLPVLSSCGVIVNRANRHLLVWSAGDETSGYLTECVNTPEGVFIVIPRVLSGCDYLLSFISNSTINVQTLGRGVYLKIGVFSGTWGFDINLEDIFKKKFCFEFDVG